MTYCVECGGIWGATSTDGEARAEMLQDAQDHWGIDVLDRVVEGIAVYLTGAQVRFANDRFGSEIMLDDCWQDAQYLDAPAWWMASLKQRDSLFLDCCVISQEVWETRRMEKANAI